MTDSSDDALNEVAALSSLAIDVDYMLEEELKRIWNGEFIVEELNSGGGQANTNVQEEHHNASMRTNLLATARKVVSALRPSHPRGLCKSPSLPECKNMMNTKRTVRHAMIKRMVLPRPVAVSDTRIWWF